MQRLSKIECRTEKSRITGNYIKGSRVTLKKINSGVTHRILDRYRKQTILKFAVIIKGWQLQPQAIAKKVKISQDDPRIRALKPGFSFPLPELPWLNYLNKPGWWVSFVSIQQFLAIWGTVWRGAWGMGHGAWGMGLPGVPHKPAICCNSQ